MFSRSSANKEEDSSNGGGGGGQAGSSGGSRSTSGSMFGFFSGSSSSSTNPSSSSKKKEKPLPLRPPESLPPQQYHRYAPHPSRPSPPHPDHLPSSSSRRAVSNSQPHSTFDEQAPPPRARTSSRPPYSPTHSSQPLPGPAHDSAAAAAPHRTTHHSRNKSSSGLTTENRGSSPPRRLVEGDVAVVDKDAAPAEEPWEREARLMREERAERAKGHRISNSLDRKPPKLTIDPQAVPQPRDQFHIPSFPFQAPTPTTALSTHASMPSLASELALLATEPPKQDPSLPPPPLPIPTPAPVPPPPPPSAAWGNLLSLSSAQTKSNSHNSSSSMFGPPVFSSSRPRRAASPPPPAPPARSSSPPPPPPPPPETKRSASNPLAVQTPLEPPAAISQPPPSSSPKWKSLLPRGPNANVHAPTEEPSSSTPPPSTVAPRPPFLSSHKASSSIGEPSSTQATASPWENLLALSSAAGPSTIHGPPIFHLPASNPSTPPATAAAPPPPPSSSDANPPPANQYHTTNPWENLMAAAANGTTPPIPSTSSSSTRTPHSKSSHKQPSHPPTALPPPPTSSSSRHKPSSSIGGGGLLVPAPNLLSKREDRTGPLGGVPSGSGSGSGSGGIGITGFVKGGNGDGSKGKGKPEMSTSPCICCSATLQYPKTVSSFRCTVCGTITDTDLSSRRAAGLPKQSDPFPLSINRFRALLDSARNASNAPSSPSASSFNLEDYESDDEVEEARTIEGDSGEEEEREREREGTGGGGEEGRRRRRSGGGGLRLEVQEEKKEKEEWWRPLEAELFAVFSHWSSLSGSFSNGVEPSIFDPGVDMIELRAFYELLSILPSELGQAVVKGLEGLLRRPRRRFDSGLGPKGLSWVLIVLENPLLFRNGSNESQAAGSVIKRFLGFVSNLANDQHHYLVHWFCRLYTAEEFQRRVELINITLVPRIRKHMQASDVAPALRASKPLPYLHDWKFRSAARTLSLFYAANALSQQIPVSSFYITLLDNLDVVADYECWIRTASTSSKSAFFLSQYPFLLSLGAKLKVLVHDSKKQQQQAQSSIDPSDGRRLVQPHITIRVRRDRLLEDSLNQISSSIHHLKRALRIEFAGEEGVDAGGLKKEWFLLLVRELLDPRYGMWLTDEDSSLCWFNPASLESAEQYTLIGVVVGLAVYHASVLDIPLPGAAFKRLLNKPVTIDDLAEWQPALARGLKNLLKFEGDVETVFCRSFVGEYESYGEIISVPLIPGGADIPVTEKNREEYVDRLVQFLLVDSVSRQFKAFQRGWLSVCEGNALSLFHAEEIELLVRGSPEALDVGQLRSVTVLDGFSPSDPLIESLWALIGSFDPQEQRKFLAFVTGSDRIPATGVGAMVFRVQANNHPLTHLPTTHTCFNLLSLPRYRSRSALNKKLVEAVGMSSGFGLK